MTKSSYIEEALSKVDLLRYVNEEYIFFKITPHANNLNSASRKFMNSLYELFSYKHQKFPWDRERFLDSFHKENLHLSIREAPKFWWILRMRGLKGVKDANNIEQLKQSIEYFIAIPEDFREAFKTKFSNHEQWRSASLDEVDNPFFVSDESSSASSSFQHLTPLNTESPFYTDLKDNNPLKRLTKPFKSSRRKNRLPKDETDIYSLRYTRNDMFSLNFDYKQQNYPVRDLLTISRDLAEGEELVLYIQSQSVTRKKWRQLVDYSWSIWDRGHVPSKVGVDPTMLFENLTNAGATVAYEAKGIVDDVLEGFTSAFFVGIKEEKKEKKKRINISAERNAILVNGDLSRQTKTKRNTPVFKTDILYTVTSKDTIKRDMLARSVGDALSELNGDNILKPSRLLARSQKEVDELRKLNYSAMFSNMMSIEELGKLHQLPTAEIQREFQDSLEYNSRVEGKVHKDMLDPSGIFAGYVTLRGERIPIHIQTKALDIMYTARAMVGSPRMGKDQMAINLIVESKRKHNMGAVILDVINEQNGHRGMADAVRDHLPPEDVVDINLLDTNFPPYLGLDPVLRMIKDKRIGADRVAEELCHFLLTDGDEDKLRTVEYLREAAKLTNGDVLAIRHVFTSNAYRKKLLAEKEHLFDTTLWLEYDKLSDNMKQSIYSPIMRRIGQIMSSEFLKPIFCQIANNKLDLYKLIDEGKVVIFRMKAGVMSQRVIEILTYWIVLITFLIKLDQDGKSQSNGTYLVLNEPFQYLTPNLANLITDRILPEGPKKKFVPVIIYHHAKQFRKFPGFVEMLKTASLNWHIFRNTNDDIYKDMFPYLSNTFESPQQAFEATQRFQYIGLFLNSTGQYFDPFVADSPPMVGDRYPTIDNSNLTLEHSKIYGRPIDEVLEEIKGRNRAVLEMVDEA